MHARGIAAGTCLVALLAALPSSALGWGPSNHLDPAFCDTSTVRGNPEQMKGLPPLRRVPADRGLPFLPDTLSVKPSDEFQVGDGTVGFTISQRDGRRTPPLDLVVEATFLRVDKRGRVTELLGRTYTAVTSVKGYETVSLAFDIDRPGLYRADVSFSDGNGDRLGRYGTYTRLLPTIIQPPRLALNAKAFAPGNFVLARVENFSRDSISYGVPYSIQRWDGMGWVKAPESPGRFIKPLYISPPGSTGPCLAFGIRQTMAPGAYRMVKGVRIGDGARILTAGFKVGLAS